MANAEAEFHQWVVNKGRGIDGVELQSGSEISASSLSSHECLVRIDAVSLNYRDVAIPEGLYPGYARSQYIPCSDGAGVVLQVGPEVTQFKKGDRVCPTFFQDFVSGSLTPEKQASSLGGKNDGVLRSHAVFDEKGLIKVPDNMSIEEASTLPCAALTAWNALFGLEGRQLRKGDYVLTQGTGGVSLFAIQIALAAGATVIATTSSDEKTAKLKAMGLQHVLNYKTDTEWGETAKRLTPGGLGVHHIIEVGGNASIGQSFKAIMMEGVISVIGFLGGMNAKSNANFGEALSHICIVRGVNVGSKEQFGEMNKFLEKHRIKPVIERPTFKFEEANKALKHLQSQAQWGKVVIVSSNR